MYKQLRYYAMSQGTSDNFVKKLLLEDNELLKKFNEIKDNPEKLPEVYAILRERIERFRVAERLPIHPFYKTYISSLKDGAFYFNSLIWTQNQFAEQVSQITTRLDDLENDNKKIKEKLGIS